MDTVEKSFLSPKWTTLQGGDPGKVDAFNSIEEPTPEALLSCYEDTVYSCACWLSDRIAAVPLRVYVKTLPGQPKPKCATGPVQLKSVWAEIRRKAEQDQLQEVLDHELVTLLDRPHPEMTFSELMRTIDLHLSLTGNAFLRIIRDEQDLPEQLDVLQVQNVKMAAEGGKIVGVFYSLTSPPEFYPNKDIIHFKLLDPKQPYSWGYPPTRAIYERVLLAKNELAWLNTLFRNQARPDGIVAVKGGITAVDQERLQKELNQRFRQGGQGGWWVVDAEEMEAKPLSWSPKDIFGTELYKWTKLQIINAFKLNPAFFDSESSNRAVATTAERQAEREAIAPRLKIIEHKLNHQLAACYDRRLVLAFDNPVQADQDFELQENTAYLDRQVLTVNEVRKKLSLPAAAWGNRPIQTVAPAVQTGPFGGGGKGVSVTDRPFRKALSPEEQLEQRLRYWFGRQMEYVLSGRKAITEVIDLSHFTELMADDLLPILKLTWEESARSAVAEITRQTGQEALDLFTVVQPNIDQACRALTLQFCQSTNSTTSQNLNDALDTLRQQLEEGITQGERQNALAERVRTIFEEMDVSKSYQIAHTEQSRARNAAVIVTGKASGVADKKRWVLSSNACPLCRQFAGMVVPIDEPFGVIGTGPYSVIDHAPAHPHCRCSLALVVTGINDEA